MASRPSEHAVTTTQARAQFDDIVRRASVGGEAIVVEDDGGPSVVIVSLPRYEELLREARLARFERASRVAGVEAEQQGLTEEQLEREMEEIKQRRYHGAYG